MLIGKALKALYVLNYNTPKPTHSEQFDSYVFNVKLSIRGMGAHSFKRIRKNSIKILQEIIEC